MPKTAPVPVDLVAVILLCVILSVDNCVSYRSASVSCASTCADATKGASGVS